MNITEMFSTTGEVLFYAGIAGTAVSILLLVILMPIFSCEKKKLIRKIEAEYSDKQKNTDE